MTIVPAGPGATDPLLEALRERYGVDVPVVRSTLPASATGFEKAVRRLDAGAPGAVAGLVRRADGALLWIRQDPATGWPEDAWLLPGGGVEPEESFEAAAEREVREETGLAARVDRPLLVLDQTITHGDRALPGVPFAFFGLTPVDADAPLTPGEGEVVEVRWWSQVPDGAFDRVNVARALAAWDANEA